MGHGYTEKTLGLLTSAMAVGNLVGAIPAGRLAQRLGLRPVLLACFLLATVVFSARSLLFGLAWQISLAFIAGIALAAWAVCIPPTVAQLTDEQQRPLAFSFVFSLGIGVGAVGGLFGGRLPGWIGSHHTLFQYLEPDQLVLLLSCCIVGIGIWPAAKLRLKRCPSPPRTTTFFSPFMLRYLPAIAAWSLVTGSFSPFANVYFKRHLHMTLPQIGNAFSISQIAQVAAVLISPLIFKRFGLLAGIVYTQLVGALLLFTLSAVSTPLAGAVVYVGFTTFQWMNEPGLYSLLMNNVSPQERGAAAASNTFIIAVSQAIAAAIAGEAFSRLGYPTALRCIGLLALLAAMLFWTLQNRSFKTLVQVFETEKE
jgi:MFS family permease